MTKLFCTGIYPPHWPELAKVVKDAAEWRCVRCAHVHDPAVGRCLTVHHFDGDKSNCERWNLMALCQACHLSVQGRVDPSMPLMFEPSAWAIPYVAGYYESGQGVPGLMYDLANWAHRYIHETGNLWPWWAPMVNPLPTMPRQGQSCSLEQLAAWICDESEHCPHARKCSEQPEGPDAVCFAVQHDEVAHA